jgi:hypothetical protein
LEADKRSKALQNDPFLVGGRGGASFNHMCLLSSVQGSWGYEITKENIKSKDRRRKSLSAVTNAMKEIN